MSLRPVNGPIVNLGYPTGVYDGQKPAGGITPSNLPFGRILDEKGNS